MPQGKTKSHRKNADTILDEGNPNQVTAAETRTHLDDDDKHRLINDSGTLVTELLSIAKHIADLLLKEDKSNKGVNNGYAPLDGSALVPLSSLPDSVKTGSEYKGEYNATTNTPTLINGTGSNGDYHRVAVAGSQDFGAGSITFFIGDIVVYNGTTTLWQRIAGNPDLVQSVAGKQGVVTLDMDDLSETATGKIFSNVERSKLTGIELNATQDQTASEIETLYEGLANTNKYTDAEKASVASALQNLIEDLTPQLGGDLDVNGKQFTGDGVFVEFLTVASRLAVLSGDGVDEIYSMANYPAEAGGVRTLTVDNEDIIKVKGLTTADRFAVPDASTNNQKAEAFNIHTLTYTGLATLYSGANVGFLQFFDLTIIGNSSATAFDITGGQNLPAKQVALVQSRLDNFDSIGRLEDIFLLSNKVAYLNNNNGIQIFNPVGFLFDAGPIFNFTDKSSIFIEIDGDIDIVGTIQGLDITTFPNESAINIRPNIEDGSSITIQDTNFIDNEFTKFLGDVFWQGVTGNITAIADASIGSTAITSVIDSSGVARFNFTGPTVYQFQKVTISGFITNTAYNVTGIITATDGTGYFEISRIAFGSDEAVGSFVANSITITSAAHGQSNGQGLSIKETVFHNVGSYAYNVQINTFQVNNNFISTFPADTGIWDTSSLDQTDPKVTSVPGNKGLNPSQTIGSFISQGNDQPTVISAIGEGESGYVNINLFQANGAITAYSNNGAGGTTVAAAGHGLPNERLIAIEGSANYSGRKEIFNVLAGSFDIDTPFVGDDGASTWETGAFPGLDIEEWELVDRNFGVLKYIGKSDKNGTVNVSISSLAAGGAARRYKFRLVKSSDNGLTWVNGFAMPDEIKNTISNTSFLKSAGVKENDLVAIEVANFQDTTNIIIDTISFSHE